MIPTAQLTEPNTLTASIKDSLNALSKLNLANGHRQIALISGETREAWAFVTTYLGNSSGLKPGQSQHIQVVSPKGSIIEALCTETPISNTKLSLSRPDKPNTLLGFDCDNAIIDLSQGFYPDALTAIAGTIHPGGWLFVICPNLDDWPSSADNFASKRTPHGFQIPASSPNIIKRFIKTGIKYGAECINISSGTNGECIAIHSDQQKSVSETSAQPAVEHWINPTHQDKQLTEEQLTEEQAHVLKTLYESLTLKSESNPTKQDSKPALFHIIQADRGRGKSHLLGHLINQLFSQLRDDKSDRQIDNGINYCITAPNKAAIQTVIKSASNSDIQFIAPENVLSKVKTTDILIIDEAASLPLPLLMSWALQFKTLIFATTTHGYEGTGKGFQIRFINYLKTLSGNIHQHTLTQAIRYADNDPLEQTMFESFALNSEPKGLCMDFSQQQIQQAQCRHIPQQELANNPALLEELFSLLVQAHYQTRPSDIRDILDAPGLAIYGTFISASNTLFLVSACLVSYEGSLKSEEQDLIGHISKGIRRPQGHLIPQVLTLHMNQGSALLLSGARVIRIATLANVQNKNLASKLVSYISKDLADQKIDYLGSSYADTKDVNNFWIKNGFNAVRSGKKQDKASGTFSTLVLKGLSKQGKILEGSCLGFFNNQQDKHESFESLSVQEKQLIYVFITATGSYEAVKDILSRCSNWLAFYNNKPLPKKASQPLRELVKNWSLL
jgi:tRNA(Met) cytidine acetyltransferase